MKLWMVIVMVMLAEGFLHYFPWRVLFKGKELHRLMAYTLGLLGMMGPLTTWLWERRDTEVIQTLWIVILCAGITVSALYGLDHYLELIMKDIEATEREQHGKDQTRE